MKKIITKAAFAAILAFGANPLYAGPGHDHDHGHNHSHTKVNEAQAKKIAIKELKRYVAAGKLDMSWKDVPVKSVEQKIFHSMPEWVFTFNNPQEPKQEQHNLYIFINQYGEMTGANFTGE